MWGEGETPPGAVRKTYNEPSTVQPSYQNGAVAAGSTVLLTPPAIGTAARFYQEWAAAVGATWMPALTTLP